MLKIKTLNIKPQKKTRHAKKAETNYGMVAAALSNYDSFWLK